MARSSCRILSVRLALSKERASSSALDWGKTKAGCVGLVLRQTSFLIGRPVMTAAAAVHGPMLVCEFQMPAAAFHRGTVPVSGRPQVLADMAYRKIHCVSNFCMNCVPFGIRDMKKQKDWFSYIAWLDLIQGNAGHIIDEVGPSAKRIRHRLYTIKHQRLTVVTHIKFHVLSHILESSAGDQEPLATTPLAVLNRLAMPIVINHEFPLGNINFIHFRRRRCA